MRVTLFTIGAVQLLSALEEAAGVDERHLPAPKLNAIERRRLNAWDDLEDIFIDIGDFMIDVGDIFVDGWEDIETFFSEDMVQWFEEDFVDFWEDLGESFITGAEIAWDDTVDFGEWTGEQFVIAWDATLDGLEDAWEWTESTAVTAWSDVENFFEMLGCVVEDLTGHTCIECVKDACNSSLSDDLIMQIEKANGVAIMDMNDEFDSMINGCASAMESCPPLEVCTDLYNLSPATQQYVMADIAKCNMCWQCLPYGSTHEGCKAALDQVMPNECEGCTESQLRMYQGFYSCSGLEVIYEAIEDIGEAYTEGADGYEALNEVCNYCPGCSDYTEELIEVCTQWATIKAGWDCEPPHIPEVLIPEGVVLGESSDSDDVVKATSPPATSPPATPAPTPSESSDSDDAAPSEDEAPSYEGAPTPTPRPIASPVRRPTQKPTPGRRPVPQPTQKQKPGRPGRGRN